MNLKTVSRVITGILAIVFIVVLGLFFTLSAETSSITASIGVGDIVFVSDRDGDSEIFVMNADGTNVVQLTSNTFNDAGPYWSPGGTKIVFHSDRTGYSQLWIMNADGSNPQQLLSSNYIDEWPIWGANNKIAFSRFGDFSGFRTEIFFVSSTGTNIARVTNTTGETGGYTHKSWASGWSPSGNKLYFYRYLDGYNQLWVSNSDGSGQYNLTVGNSWNSIPSMSPNGNKIAFSSFRDGNYEIYKVDPDGGNAERLTNSNANDWRPNWAPAGDKVIFEREVSGNTDIYVMGTSGQNVTRLTSNTAFDGHAVWRASVVPTPTPTPTQNPYPVPTATPTATPLPTFTPTPVPPTGSFLYFPIIRAPIPLNLTVAHIEITQAIQHLNNSVPLVANKPTIVRVFVSVSGVDTSISSVTAKLHASLNGAELASSPISPFNTGSVITAPLVPNRDEDSHTLNFQLPADWLTAGPLTIWAEVNPTALVLEDDYSDNVSLPYLVNFENMPNFDVVLVPIAYQRNGTGAIYHPDISEETDFGLGNMLQFYPTAAVDFSIHDSYYFGGDLSTTTGWLNLIYELVQLRLQERPNENVYDAKTFPKYYGVVSFSGGPFAAAGYAYVGGTTGAGIDIFDNIAAHELGHNIGALHIACGGPANPDPNYPYDNGAIGNTGFNAYTQQIVKSTQFKDFMSYCFPDWASDYHYMKTWEILQQSNRDTLGGISQKGWLLSGNITDNGASAKLGQVLAFTTTNLVNNFSGQGEYKITLHSSDGLRVYSYAFDPAVAIGEPIPGSLNYESSSTVQADFAFVVPQVASATVVKLWKGTKLLDTKPVYGE